jgi:hypothetical protein
MRKEVTSMPEPAESGREKESAASRREPSRLGSADETEQLVMTVSTATGDIVKIERLDKAGKREELSDAQCAELAGDDEVEEIEAGLEEAFEAGVAATLGEDDEGADDEEAIERLLIGRLIERRPGLRGLRRRFLHRLLLRRLLRRRIVQRRVAEGERTPRTSTGRR